MDGAVGAVAQQPQDPHHAPLCKGLREVRPRRPACWCYCARCRPPLTQGLRHVVDVTTKGRPLVKSASCSSVSHTIVVHTAAGENVRRVRAHRSHCTVAAGDAARCSVPAASAELHFPKKLLHSKTYAQAGARPFSAPGRCRFATGSKASTPRTSKAGRRAAR